MKRVRFEGGLWHGQIRNVDKEKRTIGFGGKVQGMYLISGYVGVWQSHATSPQQDQPDQPEPPPSE